MHAKNILSALVVTLGLSLLTVSLAQSPERKKKPIKDFGSSLKRLKWDPKKNAAVEVAPDSGHGQEVNEDDVIRIDTSLVSSDLLVLDERGNNVIGLTAADFVIVEDGEPQTVAHLFKGDNVEVPRAIVLVIDYSSSQLPYIKNSVAAAKVLVDKLGPKDQMAIVTDDVELLLAFTKDKRVMKEMLDVLLARAVPDQASYAGRLVGKSMQYSALMATLKEAFDGEDLRPIVIFQTDGDEAWHLRNSTIEARIPPELEGDELKSAQRQAEQWQKQRLDKLTEFSIDDVYQAVEKSRATVYTVIPGNKQLELTPDEQVVKMRAARQKIHEAYIARQPPDRQEFLKKVQETQKPLSLAFQKYTNEHTFNLQTALAAVGPRTGGWTEFLETPEQAGAIYARI